jgi:hypothetical protein
MPIVVSEWIVDTVRTVNVLHRAVVALRRQR